MIWVETDPTMKITSDQDSHRKRPPYTEIFRQIITNHSPLITIQISLFVLVRYPFMFAITSYIQTGYSYIKEQIWRNFAFCLFFFANRANWRHLLCLKMKLHWIIEK